jgi:mannose-6-phosphate isomerase-like protein (cupin superfamily)
MIIQRLDECPECTAGDATRLRELLHPGRQPAAISYSLAHARLEPGRSSLPHILLSSEVYYILAGRGIMDVGGERCAVEPGQAVYIPPGTVQQIRNTGSDQLVFLCIVDPAWQPADEAVLSGGPQPGPDTRTTVESHARRPS